ncbi:MAG: hypothetical protein IJX78_01200 [Bacilli bacterium]|nr:hypothetical protein [Bacilli bacterium]
MSEETKKEFKNRNSSKTNHRILNVLNVSRNDIGEIEELIVSVERCDDVIADENNSEVENEGTKLEAETLNEIIREMILEIKNKSVETGGE